MMTIVKSAYGWRAWSAHTLTNGYELTILTAKSFNNLLSTSASAAKTDGDNFPITLKSDFCERVTRSNVRCTEKNVRGQHARALLQEHGLIARAEAHYAKKEAA